MILRRGAACRVAPAFSATRSYGTATIAISIRPDGSACAQSLTLGPVRAGTPAPAQGQALRHGVKITGCTVHFVNEALDAGPIILQRAVEVREDDNIETLSARILEQEHETYVQAVTILTKRT